MFFSVRNSNLTLPKLLPQFNLLFTILIYSELISMPMQFLFSSKHAFIVVPEPRNGSRIVSHSLDDVIINFLINSSGFSVGWFVSP